ncbi:hypothetical protein [Hyphococcus luteus]|uniref:Uncharacterized protein n=1 Tax=Hyphococcus luteus TaxID=2058213 RepID=A0A2S7K548_9PROT|nr:hypothetical protein [Marinicaulis flavus]PQA87635.1 hypothetical protein CW354_11200 [Marinicaulis flavus]
MDWSLFAFAFDGHVDHHSINPLEMTNYERFGYICGFVAVIVAIIWDRLKKRKADAAPETETLYTPATRKSLSAEAGEKK